MINYSIIIPHKNIPNLLQRSLDSIPRRADVQIIVVDDNSDADKVDFENFPGLNDPFVEVVFGKNEDGRKGAGYARNLGLERATGKWLIFADADDFFMPCFNEVLDEYRDNENDIIYFRNCSIDSKTLSLHHRANHINKVLDYMQKTNDWRGIYYLYVPWGKFIKRTLIERNQISFQEIPYSNDVFFSLRSSIAAQNKLVVNREIYCVTYRADSLDGHYTFDIARIRLFAALDIEVFLRKIGKHQYYVHSANIWWKGMYRISPTKALLSLLAIIKRCGIIHFSERLLITLRNRKYSRQFI
jgi:glycosyltransferase involved in cell wall biosynthesis